VRSAGVVVLDEGVELGLECSQCVWLVLAGEPVFECLVEAFHLPAGLGMVGPGVPEAEEHSNDPGRRPIGFHRHQADAISAAASGKSYVLTTGTGSGKSLGYIVTIVDRVLREKDGASGSRGVKAIIVYPMNALANSQVFELEKFLRYGYGEVTPGSTVEVNR
jgi:hypothetical protein